MNVVIGIEGLVGAGKTSICRELLNEIPNSILLNGGNLYRGILSVLLKEYGSIDKLKENASNIDIRELMKKMKIEIKIEKKETVFFYKGEKLEDEELQSTKSSMAVSVLGGQYNNENLFKFAKSYIDELKKNYNVIVSGRSIMKIYPNINYHFFITASLEQRITRKSNQYNGKVDIKELEEHILKRDKLQESYGFYQKSSNTITVDVTDCQSIKESTKKVLNYII